jgi:hypothetical protein
MRDAHESNALAEALERGCDIVGRTIVDDDDVIGRSGLADHGRDRISDEVR